MVQDAFTEEITKVYKHLLNTSFYVEKSFYHQKDLVHEVLIDFLSNKEKFMSTEHTNSWLSTNMKWKKLRLIKESSREKTDLCENYGFLDYKPSTQLNNQEAELDLNLILSYFYSDGFEKKSNDVEIFELKLEGYKFYEIANKLKVSKGLVYRRLDYIYNTLKMFAGEKLNNNNNE